MSQIFKTSELSVPMSVRVAKPILTLSAIDKVQLKSLTLNTMRHEIFSKLPKYVTDLATGELEQLMFSPLIDLALENKSAANLTDRIQELAEDIKSFVTVAKSYPSKHLNNAITSLDRKSVV